MGNFKAWLIRFMGGRYGMDDLNKALTVAYVALLLINTIAKSSIISAIPLAIIVAVMYRSLSRDIGKRTRENESFKKLWKPIRRQGRLAFRKIRYIRTKRFRSCPSCKATIEMPIKKGTRDITCPKCRAQFQATISF